METVGAFDGARQASSEIFSLFSQVCMPITIMDTYKMRAFNSIMLAFCSVLIDINALYYLLLGGN